MPSLDDESKSDSQPTLKRPLTARRRRPPPLSSNNEYKNEDDTTSNSAEESKQHDFFDSAQAGETISEITNSDPLLSILNKTDEDYNNDLLLAAETGNMKLLSALLSNPRRKAGSAANSRSNSINGGVSSNDALHSNTATDAMTPLHLAASRGRTAAANALLLAGSPVDALNVSGETPLHLACYSGDMTLAEMLIDFGAEINARNEYGETPLHYASRRSKAASVQMLLQRGCDVTITSSLGDTALDEAGDARCETHLKAYSENKDSNDNVAPSTAAHVLQLNQPSLLRIFSYLTVSDLCNSACVCGRWHRTIEEPSLWRNLGVRRWELALAASMKNVNVNNENEYSRLNAKRGGGGVGGGGGGGGKSSSSMPLDPFTPAPMTSMFRVGGSRKKK